MGAPLHDHPALTLLVIMLTTYLLWAGVRRILVGIVLVALALTVGGALLGIGSLVLP